MDLNTLKSVITNELSQKTSLESLKLQNHIYGCFLIMEDIAQQKVNFNNNVISTKSFTLDLDKQFSEIGIRFGFVMDTKLLLTNNTKEYKDIWLKNFNDIDISRDIDEVDKIEDCINQIIVDTVKEEDAFYINSLEGGSLSQEWLDKVIKLLTPPPEEEEVVKTVLTTAVTEKPIKKRLSSTRRNINKNTAQPTVKKPLSKTRRHH